MVLDTSATCSSYLDASCLTSRSTGKIVLCNGQCSVKSMICSAACIWPFWVNQDMSQLLYILPSVNGRRGFDVR